MTFKVLSMPEPVAEQVRRTGRAPGFGHPAQASVAGPGGYGPCRLCLRRTRQGERRLLFTYNPFPEPGEVPVAGPVFIHETPCKAFDGPGLPEELRTVPFLLRGHLRGGSGIVNRHLEGQVPETAIAALFENPEVAFIALHNADAGCFIARVERARA